MSGDPLIWWILGYILIGIIVVGWLCPVWSPLDLLVGSALWPVILIIGIAMMVQEFRLVSRPHNSDLDFEIMVLNAMIHDAKQKQAKQEEPWTPDRN